MFFLVVCMNVWKSVFVEMSFSSSEFVRKNELDDQLCVLAIWTYVIVCMVIYLSTYLFYMLLSIDI